MSHVAFTTPLSMRPAQRGAALVVGLVLMLVLTALLFRAFRRHDWL